VSPDPAGSATPPRGHERWNHLRAWLTRRRVAGLIALLLAVHWALTGVSAVREDEQAVVLRFGAVTRVAPAGILFTLPWPIESSLRLRTAEVRTMPIGYKLTDAVRGIAPQPQETEWVTGDKNIIDLTLTVKYVIADPVEYLYSVGPVEADFLVRRCGEAGLTELIAQMPVDELLTAGKARVQEETRRRTQDALDSLATGIRIVTVNIGEVVPPANVIAAFNDVSTAKIEKARMINEADGYAKDVLPRARATANRDVQEAESYRETVVNAARGDASRFLDLLAEARRAREITEMRLYLEAMERILPRAQKIVVEKGSGNQLRLLE
jgi:membrane protease subunit HflK